MSKRLPVELNAARLTANNAVLRGAVKLDQFHRLGEYLSTPALGDLNVELNFSHSESHANGVVKGWFDGVVDVLCHRCNEPMTLALKSHFRFYFIDNELEADKQDEDFEPVLLDENGLVRSIDLLEDELILQLPIAPRHPDGEECVDNKWLSDQPDETDETTEKAADSPFDVLKNLQLNKPLE